jgi:predicted DNA-binding ribbon-helix-helix protein
MQVRDRLAVLAAERDMTMRDLLKQLADATPTQAELQQRQAETVAFIRVHLVPGFNDEDLAAGEEIWESIHSGTLPVIGGSAA